MAGPGNGNDDLFFLPPIAYSFCFAIFTFGLNLDMKNTSSFTLNLDHMIMTKSFNTRLTNFKVNSNAKKELKDRNRKYS